MAVFADQLDLRTNVAELVGDSGIVEVWPRLLQMAETRINRRARHRKQITEVTLTFASGVVNLPADFLEVAHLYDSQSSEMFAVPLSTVRSAGSQHRYYAIDGSQIHIYGLSGDRVLEYYGKIPTISAALTDTSWLLSDYPDVYLYTAAAEAAAYLQDAERVAAYSRLADQAVSDMMGDNNRARYSRGVVIPRGINP